MNQELETIYNEWKLDGEPCPWKFINRTFTRVDWGYHYADDGRAYRSGMRTVQDFSRMFQECINQDRARALKFVRDHVGPFNMDRCGYELWFFFDKQERI